MSRLLLLSLLLSCHLAAQTPPPVNFEPSLVHPIAISPNGDRLFALNTEAGLLRVYSLAQPSRPRVLLDIPVGLAPVSLRARSNDEVWVVDSVSDSISVVSIPQAAIMRIIPVGDDPADVIFAGTPERAYVSVAGKDEVRVFDPVTETQVATVAIPGKEPRALAVNPQNNRVYVLVFRSGNRTTLIPTPFAPPPPAPTNPALPPAPPQAMIISLDDPMWAGHPLVMPDIDIVSIDTATNTIVNQLPSLGTINYDLAVDSQTGAIVVARTSAQNAIRFEPNLKSIYYQSGLSIINVTTGQVAKYHLNEGITAATKDKALSEPTAVAIDSGRRQIWIAAQGSDRIAQLNENGEVIQRIDLESQPDAPVVMRGPRGLALDAARQLLYVYNRLSHTLTIIDTAAGKVLNEVSLGWDPMPRAWRQGQRFLYDARLSGNGTVSCASCHVDAEHDLLSWDLGDPNGQMTPVPAQPPHPKFPPNALPPFAFHPMKGPMVTQTLRGLSTNAPYHWRGDKTRLQDFNGAFESLLGGHVLSQPDIDSLAWFLTWISHPGNPNQNLDRTLPAAALAGKNAFENLPAVAFPGGFQLTCMDCHAGADGAGSEIVLPLPQTFIGPTQPSNTPQLRGLFRRGEVPLTGAPSKVGFGFAHDGGLPDLRSFLDIPAFSLMPNSEKNNLAAFLMAFDTGTAPIVGHRFVVDASTANTTALFNEVNLLHSRAVLGEVDVILEARLDGIRRSFLFNPQTFLYEGDRQGSETWTLGQLHQRAASGRLQGAVMAVPPGEGARRAFDSLCCSLTHRPASGTNIVSGLVLDLVAVDQQGLDFTLRGLPAGATAQLLVASGNGRKTPLPNGSWVAPGQLFMAPLTMQAEAGFHLARAKRISTGILTVQARIQGLPGGVAFSNAMTIKLVR